MTTDIIITIYTINNILMKIIKKLFNLTLAIMLTMTQTAWATDDVTVTYRLITGTKGVIKANVEGNEQNVITPIGSTIKTKSSGHIINSTDNHETADLLITPFVNGTIKQVKFTNIGRRFEAAFGDASFYFGIEGMKYGNADAVTETGIWKPLTGSLFRHPTRSCRRTESWQ